jgi:S-adenosylmethionine hydrolase
MLGVEPSLRILDLTHEVTPFAIRDGARLLADTADTTRRIRCSSP